MQPLCVHHVSINVADVTTGIAFYTGVLGGTVRDDRPALGIGGAWIDLGATQVHLIEAAVPANLGQHFAIQVGDLDEVVAELRGVAVAVSDPVAIGANRQSFLEDPFGNAIELHEVAAAS